MSADRELVKGDDVDRDRSSPLTLAELGVVRSAKRDDDPATVLELLLAEAVALAEVTVALWAIVATVVAELPLLPATKCWMDVDSVSGTTTTVGLMARSVCKCICGMALAEGAPSSSESSLKGDADGAR